MSFDLDCWKTIDALRYSFQASDTSAELQAEAQAQDDAVQAANESLTVSLNQYRAGIISYINVTVAQSTALANQRTAAGILGQRLTASVLLIKALGGGWDAASLAENGTGDTTRSTPVVSPGRLREP